MTKKSEMSVRRSCELRHEDRSHVASLSVTRVVAGLGRGVVGNVVIASFHVVVLEIRCLGDAW